MTMGNSDDENGEICLTENTSAAVYSIIETAKANGLNPFQYLKYLFEHLPNADIQRHPEHLDDLLPWNEIIQQNCK